MPFSRPLAFGPCWGSVRPVLPPACPPLRAGRSLRAASGWLGRFRRRLRFYLGWPGSDVLADLGNATLHFLKHKQHVSHDCFVAPQPVADRQICGRRGIGQPHHGVDSFEFPGMGGGEPVDGLTRYYCNFKKINVPPLKLTSELGCRANCRVIVTFGGISMRLVQAMLPTGLGLGKGPAH